MKKVLALALAAMMLTGILAGCGSKSDSIDSQSQSESESSKKTLVMATSADFPPYEYYDEADGPIIGIDAEIFRLICEELGMTAKIEDMEFGSVLTAVSTGKADVAMAGLTVDPDRLHEVDFTDSYAKGKQVIIVKEGSDIQSADDLADKRIGVQANTTGDIYCSDDFPDADIQQYTKGADAVMALVQGKVDAVVIDNAPAAEFVKANEGLVILETAYADEEYAIAVNKGKPELTEQINTALAKLKAEGKLQEIIDKYIPAEEE